MHKLLLTIATTILCAAPAVSQKATRPSFDNFDTKHGVRIANVPTTDVLPSARNSSSVRRAASASTNISAARPKPVVYVPPPAASGSVSSAALAGFTTGNAQVDQLIVESGRRNGVDPALLYSIMHQESSFKPRAVSNKGASGLMQLMAGTAARFGVRDRFDARQNIEGGARYMRFLLNFFGGDVRLALAGYNAGEGAVLKYGRQIPPYRETQEYVRRITRRYSLLRDPETARRAQPVTPVEVASIRAQTPTQPTTYERNVFSVRLPDGRLQLVSQ